MVRGTIEVLDLVWEWRGKESQLGFLDPTYIGARTDKRIEGVVVEPAPVCDGARGNWS